MKKLLILLAASFMALPAFGVPEPVPVPEETGQALFFKNGGVSKDVEVINGRTVSYRLALINNDQGAPTGALFPAGTESDVLAVIETFEAQFGPGVNTLITSALSGLYIDPFNEDAFLVFRVIVLNISSDPSMSAQDLLDAIIAGGFFAGGGGPAVGDVFGKLTFFGFHDLGEFYNVLRLEDMGPFSSATPIASVQLALGWTSIIDVIRDTGGVNIELADGDQSDVEEEICQVRVKIWVKEKLLNPNRFDIPDLDLSKKVLIMKIRAHKMEIKERKKLTKRERIHKLFKKLKIIKMKIKKLLRRHHGGGHHGGGDVDIN